MWATETGNEDCTPQEAQQGCQCRGSPPQAACTPCPRRAVVTAMYGRLHWRDVTMGWCFRTGPQQTEDQSRLFLFRSNSLMLEALRGKRIPFWALSLPCFAQVDTAKTAENESSNCAGLYDALTSKACSDLRRASCTGRTSPSKHGPSNSWQVRRTVPKNNTPQLSSRYQVNSCLGSGARRTPGKHHLKTVLGLEVRNQCDSWNLSRNIPASCLLHRSV